MYSVHLKAFNLSIKADISIDLTAALEGRKGKHDYLFFVDQEYNQLIIFDNLCSI